MHLSIRFFQNHHNQDRIQQLFLEHLPSYNLETFRQKGMVFKRAWWHKQHTQCYNMEYAQSNLESKITFALGRIDKLYDKSEEIPSG